VHCPEYKDGSENDTDREIPRLVVGAEMCELSDTFLMHHINTVEAGKEPFEDFPSTFLSLRERLDWETQRRLGGFQRKSGYLQALRVRFRIHSSTRSAEEWVGGMIAAAYDVFCRTLAICLIAFGHRKMEHDFGGQILSDKFCHLLEAQDYEELRLKFEVT